MYEKVLEGRLFMKQEQVAMLRNSSEKLISPRKIYLSKVKIKNKLQEDETCQIFGDIPITIIGKNVKFQEKCQRLYDGKKIISQQLYVEGEKFLDKMVVMAF